MKNEVGELRKEIKDNNKAITKIKTILKAVKKYDVMKANVY